MRFTSLAALCFVGCALALPGRHVANRQQRKEIPMPTKTIDLTEPGSAPSLPPIYTPIWTPQPSRRPIPTSTPTSDSDPDESVSEADSIRKARQKLFDDMENGASQEQLQKDIDDIWAAELAVYESWLAVQSSTFVPPGTPKSSSWPVPSGRPTPSSSMHSPGRQDGVSVTVFATETPSAASSTDSSAAGDS